MTGSTLWERLEDHTINILNGTDWHVTCGWHGVVHCTRKTWNLMAYTRLEDPKNAPRIYVVVIRQICTRPRGVAKTCMWVVETVTPVESIVETADRVEPGAGNGLSKPSRVGTRRAASTKRSIPDHGCHWQFVHFSSGFGSGQW